MRTLKFVVLVVKLYCVMYALHFVDFAYMISVIDDKKYNELIVKAERIAISCWRSCASLKVGLTEDEAEEIIKLADDLERKTDAFEYWRS